MAGCGCCAKGCPCLTLTFNNVIFDCGCFNYVGGGSGNFTDTGNFNGVEFDTQIDGDLIGNCAPCRREPAIGAVTLPSMHEFFYGDADCTTLNYEQDDNLSDILVANISGLWHVGARFGDILVFYGTTTDLSIPVNNQISCNSTPEYLVNDFTACFNWGPRRWDNIQFYNVAHGGTATIGVQEHCGRCEFGNFCDRLTPIICAAFGGIYEGDGTDCIYGGCCVGVDCGILPEENCLGFAGTYQGDGTDCDPNPC